MKVFGVASGLHASGGAQRRAATHHPGVDGPHEERTKPGLKIKVINRCHRIQIGTGSGHPGRAGVQQEGIGQQFGLTRVHEIEHRRQRAAIHAAAQAEAGLHAVTGLAVLLLHGLRDQPRPQVGWHRIKAAKRDDAGAVESRLCMVLPDQAVHPRRLAGDVHIMRAVLDAGRDQRTAIQRERTGRAEHHGTVAGQRIKRLNVLRISHHNARFGSTGPAGRLDGLQPVGTAPGQRPAKRLGACCAAGRALCKIGHRLATDKAGGAIEHHIVLAFSQGCCHFDRVDCYTNNSSVKRTL